jgi:hypothetical protein
MPAQNSAFTQLAPPDALPCIAKLIHVDSAVSMHYKLILTALSFFRAATTATRIQFEGNDRRTAAPDKQALAESGLRGV